MPSYDSVLYVRCDPPIYKQGVSWETGWDSHSRHERLQPERQAVQPPPLAAGGMVPRGRMSWEYKLLDIKVPKVFGPRMFGAQSALV
jgi:hypothetical protein